MRTNIIFFLPSSILTRCSPSTSFEVLRAAPPAPCSNRAATRTSGPSLHQSCLHSSPRSHEDLNNSATAPIIVDRQSDEKYDRGAAHISADLNEGDIIAYQDGTWYVDGTEVGDGSSPVVRYVQVDTIQLVWTHDCEHGVINGFDIMIANDTDGPASVEGQGAAVEKGSYLVIMDDYIQIGPEQILGRIPTMLMKEKWKDTSREMWMSRADFNPDEEMTTS